MPLLPGTRLAHYVIEHPLGAGGMGEVYAAQDTKLTRRVAIKVLTAVASTAEIQRRLQREAQTIAALNHPHIVTIYSIEQEGPHTFMTMELVEGMSLGDAIDGRPMASDRLLTVATELVDAVAAAHEKGVVHRDIKPGNVMIARDLRTKVLDFGIAKALGRDVPVGDATITQSLPGLIIGSAPYMSPEQARGDAVDHRTDIFSIGVTMFEMLTGRRPFGGRTSADLTVAILTSPIEFPPPATTLHGELQRVISRCLEKDPSNRYQTAADLGSELRRLRRSANSGVATVRPDRRARIMPALVMAVITAIAVGAWIWQAQRETPNRSLAFSNPRQLTFAQGAELDPTWSPDGTRVAYHLNADIWVTQIGGASVNLTNSPSERDRMPSWSPGGDQIAFVSSAQKAGIFLVPAVGGAVRKVIDVGARSSFMTRSAWSADGKQLAIAMYDDDRRARLVIADAANFAVRYERLSGVENTTGQDLAWSTDGRLIAYIDATLPLPEVSRLWVQRLGQGAGIAVSDGKTLVRSPQFSRDGRALFYVSNSGGSSDLFWQALSPDGSPVGEPSRMTTGVGLSSATFSSDGKTLAYSRGREQLANLWRVPLDLDRVMTWADATQLTFDDALIEFVDITRDGSSLFFSSDRRGNQDIWQMPAAGGALRQITFEPSPDWRPSLSPDQQHLAFYSYRTGNRELWRMTVDGAAPKQLTFSGGTYHPSWSPNGRIAYSSIQSGVRRLFMIPGDGGEPLRIGESGDNLPAWSPDGKRMVFARNLASGNLLIIANDRGEELMRFNNVDQGGRAIFTTDGQALLQPTAAAVHMLALKDGRSKVLADLSNRPGTIGQFSLTTDGRFMYFTWQTPTADIWLMDVATSK